MATDWFVVEAWGRLGEVCQKNLTIRWLVFVEGRLRIDRNVHEEETRYFTHVVASKKQMLDQSVERVETVPAKAEEWS